MHFTQGCSYIRTKQVEWPDICWVDHLMKWRGREDSARKKLSECHTNATEFFFTHRPLTCINTNHWSDDGRLESCCQRHMSINGFAVNARETISKRQSMFASSFRPARSKHCVETRFETSIVTAPRVRHCCGIGFELLRLSFSSGLMPGLLVRPKQLEGTFVQCCGIYQLIIANLHPTHLTYTTANIESTVVSVIFWLRLSLSRTAWKYADQMVNILEIGHARTTQMYFLNFLFCEKRQGLEPHFFLAWSLIKLHAVQSPPGMAASWAILGVTARMILCSAVPSKCFFRCGHLRNHCRTPHSLTYFSFGGKVVCFFDPIITSCRPSEGTKHICGGCSHTEVRHVFSRADRHRAECPECGCGKVFDDGMCHNRMRLTRPNMAQPCCPVCDGAGGTDNHQELWFVPLDKNVLQGSSTTPPTTLWRAVHSKPGPWHHCQPTGGFQDCMANWGDVAVHVVWQPRMLRLTEPLRGAPSLLHHWSLGKQPRLQHQGFPVLDLVWRLEELVL